MQKPVEVAYKDFMDGLVALINGSELPPFVCALALSSVTADVRAVADAQYKSAVEEYQKKEGGGEADG